MSDAVPRGRKQKREALLNDADEIVVVVRASGANGEELGTLSPDAVTALGTLSMFNLRHCTEIGGSEADHGRHIRFPARPAPHALGHWLRELSIAGLRQVMSGTAYENHGKFLLGLPADPLS